MKSVLKTFAAGLLISVVHASGFQVVPIPSLDSKGDVYKGEGETDPLIYDDALGEKKMIMVYLDFEDAVMDIDTKERGKQVLGGDLYEEIFDKNSYGKISFDIDHVHGWRRLPKKSGEYSSKTTDSHRELFVQIFKKYPEVNFLDYDYIVAVMPRIGNTAFGERDDIAIPYRGEMINVAMNISSPSANVLAHEIGHLMGLPDLYTYGGVDGPKNPAGPWDLMSFASQSTGFLGWHRHKLEWLDADRKTYLTDSTKDLVLTPLHADSGISMITIPVDDPKKPSKVFCIEVAQARNIKGGGQTEAGGVLVYTVDATLATGKNPVVVYPCEDINEAPFHPGDTFDHKDAPFRMMVDKRNEDGAYHLSITFED